MKGVRENEVRTALIEEESMRTACFFNEEDKAILDQCWNFHLHYHKCKNEKGRMIENCEFSAANCKRSHAKPENTDEGVLRRMKSLLKAEQDEQGARKGRKRRRRHKAGQNQGTDETSKSSGKPQHPQQSWQGSKWYSQRRPETPYCSLCHAESHTIRNFTEQQGEAPNIEEELPREEVKEVPNEMLN